MQDKPKPTTWHTTVGRDRAALAIPIDPVVMHTPSASALRADVPRWLDLPRTQALERVAQALADGHARRLPDLWLLAANLEQADATRRMACLNHTLRVFRLEPLALQEPSLAPAPGHLGPAAPITAISAGPLISVLMTVHNGQDHVAAAIRSVLAQTWRSLELIVIDDASTDNTRAVLAALAPTDPRLRLLQLPRNIGTYAAKLIGLQHATGAFITCHDADDWSHPRKLERQMAPLLQEPALVATTSCWVRIADDGTFHARQRYPLMRWNPSSTLFRRDRVLQHAGAWDAVRTGADSEFLDRLKAVFGARAVHRVSEPLALGSHRPGSLMTDAATGYDAHGRNAAREAYTQAWRGWHARVRRRGATPWITPDVVVAAAQRPFEVPASLRVSLDDIRCCMEQVGRTGCAGSPADRPVWLAASSALHGIVTLSRLLDAPVRRDRWGAGRDRHLTGVLAWGRKPSAQRAARRAADLGLPVCWIEDGFLRSFQSGPQQPPLSVVLDEEGVFYDATRPSGLESRLNDTAFGLTPALRDQATRARDLILSHGLSKYNDAPPLERVEAALGRPLLRPVDRQRVLVVDQTAGDLSIAFGAASARTFDQMLVAALADHPEATVYVKSHPEVTAGRKAGHFTDLRDTERVVVLREAIEPLSLLHRMDAVYVVSSTLGFEALLAGKPVTCFGMPWYAGWGVTRDLQRCERRTRTRSVDELFAAAYLRYARYLNPETHERGTIFDVIDWLIRQRRMAGLLAPEMQWIRSRRPSPATAPTQSPP